ncbi:MAG: hypothetical protein QCI82_00150 [Candidatus Thermoplasmatota archaeon]|nr:hypothetical protein [Candidatus Thermoplasmatota archaeon]
MNPSDRKDWPEERGSLMADVLPYLASPDQIIQLIGSSNSLEDLIARASDMLDVTEDATLGTDLRILLDRSERRR